MTSGATIHIVRHAEGYHQVPADNPQYNLRDPGLTPRGEAQCETFRAGFPHHDDIDMICASPMRRTISTAYLCFKAEVEQRGLRIILLPDAQEATDLPSDTGSEAQVLEDEFGTGLMDTSHLEPEWYVKTGKQAFDTETLWTRAARLKRWLWEHSRDKRGVVLVMHGLFAHFVTGNIDENAEQTGEYWTNTLWRSFQFSSTEGDSYDLIETAESRQRVAGRQGPEDHS